MENNGVVKLNVDIRSVEEAMLLVGTNNENLDMIEEMLHVNIIARGNEILVKNCTDKDVNDVEKVFNELLIMIRKKINVSTRDCMHIVNLLKRDKLENLKMIHDKPEKVLTTFNGKSVFPKTLNQKNYVKAIENNSMVFGVGPAGTGKTYLAVLTAVAKFKKNEIKKIILTRPAVEAGESLGFLPGDLKEKVDPYLRPLYDALYDAFGVETTEKHIENGVIEIAPLAYMRGRTLDNAYVILDEAQNTTDQQMKMFLTRLGLHGKMIINGDMSQIDLPANKNSGLVTAINILRDVKGINIVEFEHIDVVRHPLVQKIIQRYDNASALQKT